MGVSIMTPSWTHLFKAAGCPETVLTVVGTLEKTPGVTYKTEFWGIEFQYPSPDKTKVKTSTKLPILTTVLLKGNAPQDKKVQCQLLLNSTVVEVMKKMGMAVPPNIPTMADPAPGLVVPPSPGHKMTFADIKPPMPDFSSIDDMPEPVAVSTPKKKPAATFKAMPKKPVFSDPDTELKPVAKEGMPVALREATALLQKVKGTDASSVYQVIAVGPSVNIAARVKGAAVSIRAEGKMSATEAECLSNLGMSGSPSKHMSMHLHSVEGQVSKVFGSLLYTLASSGVEFKEVLPPVDVKKVKGV